MSVAMSRFASMLQIIANICYFSRGFLWLLMYQIAQRTDSATWAHNLLQLMSEPADHSGTSNFLLLALVAEFTESARNGVKKFEPQKKRPGMNNCALTARKLRNMTEELDHLFDVVDAKGQPRMPWAINPTFTEGYVAWQNQKFPFRENPPDVKKMARQ